MTTEIRATSPTADRSAAYVRRILPIPEGDLQVYGALLGFGSSYAKSHNRHDGPFATPGTRCSACRWLEVRIIELDPDGHEQKYPVHTWGKSIVTGEFAKCRAVFTNSPLEIGEVLKVRPAGRKAWISSSALRALAQAGELDDGIFEAYELAQQL